MTDDELRREYLRQRGILERQETQYQTARPRARFAYASHITKTRGKLARLAGELAYRHIDTPEGGDPE